MRHHRRGYGLRLSRTILGPVIKLAICKEPYELLAFLYEYEAIWIAGRPVAAHRGFIAWAEGQRRASSQGQSSVCGGRAVSLSRRYSVARLAGALWRLSRSPYALEPLGETGYMERYIRAFGRRCRQRICHDRRYHRSRPSTQRRGAEKRGADQAIGRSKGGLSTKIHATVDALGNPIGFHLTGGQACDLDGADVLLPQIEADTVLADKGYDADERVLRVLEQANKTAVIPPKANRKQQREYDRDLYKARHLIENFFANLKQFRAIATRYDKTARNFLAAIYFASAILWLV